MTPVDPRATALSAFRILKNGNPRAYCTVAAESGNVAIRGSVNRFHKLGYIGGSVDDSYALLDLLDGDGDIIQEYPIPHAKAFAYIKRQLHLTVVSEDHY